MLRMAEIVCCTQSAVPNLVFFTFVFPFSFYILSTQPLGNDANRLYKYTEIRNKTTIVYGQ